MSETQAPVAGADPRAWREMAERLERERGVFRAAHSDEVLALPPAGRAYVRALTGWSLNSDDATALVEEIDRQAAAARGAEGERERDELAFLRQQADALHRILPGNGDLVARAHFALSAPRPSAGPAEFDVEPIPYTNADAYRDGVAARARAVATHEPPPGGERECLLCSRTKPWGTFDARTGAVVCVDCRDAAAAARASDDPAPTTEVQHGE